MNTIILFDKRFRIVVLNVLLIITLGMTGTIHAQKTSKKNRLYKTWVKKTDSKTRLVGILYQVEDNKLQISNSFEQKAYDLNQFDYQDVYAHEIEKIKLRRKGNIGRGALTGIVSGFVTGALIVGSAEELPLLGGILLGMAGGIVGAVLGSLQIRIPINGSQQNFNANKVRLQGYSFQDKSRE